MVRFIFVLVAILGLSLPLHAAGKRCELKMLASLDVDVDQDGTVLMPVTIEGHDVWMVLSLDQGYPMLFPTAVKDLKLQTSTGDTGAMLGREPLNTIVKVKQLLVGRANYTGWELIVYPLDSIPSTHRGKPIAGMLSSRLIHVLDMELNLAENKVNLFSQTRCKGGALYWGGEYTAVPLHSDGSGLLVFPMELEEQMVETSLNTSSRYSQINTKVTRKYFGFDKDSPDVQEEMVGDREISTYRAMALTAKGLEVRNSRIRLVNAGGCEPSAYGRGTKTIGCGEFTNNAPFSIGTDLLKKLRVYIATAEKTVYFTRVDSPTSEPQPPAPVGEAAAPAR